MNRLTKYTLLAVLTALASHASTLFTLTEDACTGTCGTGPFGSVSLVQTTPTVVTVTEILAADERFAGTGAGDALEFNVKGAIIIANITHGFAIGPAPDTASAFGSFLKSVTCPTCKGGQSSNPDGPLSFTVTSASGVTIADFIANTGGIYFASDIVGSNCNTGNVAARSSVSGGGSQSTVPEPVSLALVGGELIGLALLRRRKSDSNCHP